MKSSGEEICKTRAEEDHHDRTAHRKASLPQPARRSRSSDFTTGEDHHEDPSNTPEQEPTTKVFAATKPSLISAVVAAQAITRKPRITCRATSDRNAVCVQPSKWHRRKQDLQGDAPKEEGDPKTTPVAPTQPGLGFHPRNLLRGRRSRR